MHKQFALLVYDHATATFQVRIRPHTCEYVLAHTSVCVLIFVFIVYRHAAATFEVRIRPHTSAYFRIYGCTTSAYVRMRPHCVDRHAVATVVARYADMPICRYATFVAL